MGNISNFLKFIILSGVSLAEVLFVSDPYLNYLAAIVIGVSCVLFLLGVALDYGGRH